jgi:hypothetical protein
MGPAACSFLFCYYFYFFKKILKHIHEMSYRRIHQIPIQVPISMPDRLAPSAEGVDYHQLKDILSIATAQQAESSLRRQAVDECE